MTRSGSEYIKGLNDGRQVYVDGGCVTQVSTHPAFSGVVRSIAQVYDLVNAQENRAELTFPSPMTGEPVSLAFMIPRSEADLRRRRMALERIADVTYGMIGRGPEHVAGFLAGWVGRKDVFARGGKSFAENLERFYQEVRDNDLYCAYTIVPPQIDRSKPAHQQAEATLYAGVKEERPDGLVIAGAQMLGTAAAIADYIILSCIVPLQPGDEAYAISVAIPAGEAGVRIHSRRSYASAATSDFDYPLSSRFDETDSLIVFDNVFVPWERVFIYRDLDIVSQQWNETPAHLLGNNQAQIRLAAKLNLLCGVALRVAQMNGVDKLPPVRGALGELAAHAAMVSGLVAAQEQNCEVDDHGVAWPGRAECFALMTLASEFYPRLITIVRDLCGGGVIQLPSSVRDFDNEQARADFDRFVQSPGYSSEQRVKLMKLAWDLIGSEFAGRHQQYEMFYAGAPFLVRSRMANVFDFARAGSTVDRLLGTYGLDTDRLLPVSN